MAARTGLLKAFDPVLGWMARRYQAAVAKELKNYGLRYEDLYDPEMNLDVAEALRRLPREEVDARNQRLRRAHDISLKKEYMTKDQQALQTPYLYYLEDSIAQVEAENREKFLLGTGKSYERTIP